MEHVDELIYGQALYALSADEEEQVALHVAECERCRRQLREAEALAASLAYAAPAADPPPDLRARVLGAVEPVVGSAPAAPAPATRRPRFAWWPRVAAVAVPALAAAVLGLVIWNVSLRDQVSSIQSSLQHARVTRVGTLGSALTSSAGTTTLFASIGRAPAGKTYEAWVIRGKVAIPAGIFQGGGTLKLTLTKPAKPGDIIAVTIEPAGGTKAPTSAPIANGTV